MLWVEQNLKTVCPPVWVHFSQSGSNWEALLKCKRTSMQNLEPGICIWVQLLWIIITVRGTSVVQSATNQLVFMETQFLSSFPLYVMSNRRQIESESHPPPPRLCSCCLGGLAVWGFGEREPQGTPCRQRAKCNYLMIIYLFIYIYLYLSIRSIGDWT